MRITIDIRALTEGSSGIHVYVRSLLDRLQQLDTANEYVLIETRDSDYALFNDKWTKARAPTVLPGTLWTNLKLPHIVRELRADVHWGPAFVNPVLGIDNVAMVTTIHDIAFIRHRSTVETKLGILLRRTVPYILKNSARVITVSRFSGHELASVYGRETASKLVVIPNGKPDWTPSASRRKDRNRCFLFAGNFEPRKNLQTLIHAMEILKSQGKGINLKIVGPPGWKNRSVMKYLVDSPVAQDVEILGYISEQKLRQLYRTSRGLVYPSVYEGFGLPVLEALAMECPVLTSKGTVMEEIAGDCAIYFDPYSPSDIARAIETVSSADFNRSTLMANREAVLNRYDWRLSAERHLDAFGGAHEEQLARKVEHI